MAIDPNLVTTVRVGELPPVPPTLLSKVPHELGDVLNYYTIEQLVAFLQPYISTFQYEEKTLHVTTQYIIDNFDETGLGINLMVGWAMCNGANTAPNLQGRVSIGYGGIYNVIGQTGGSKDAVVVSHSHTYTYENTRGTGIAGAEDGTSGIETGTTSTVGESGTDKNMQPYIVALKIYKL